MCKGNDNSVDKEPSVDRDFGALLDEQYRLAKRLFELEAIINRAFSDEAKLEGRGPFAEDASLEGCGPFSDNVTVQALGPWVMGFGHPDEK